MSHPFPGMKPYLDHPVFWREMHKRLIVAIADYLSPQVRPVFIVVIQERVYKDVDYDAVFVDNRDVAVKDSQITEKSEKGNITVAASEVKPIKVTLPIPETFRESYLEIRDVNTKKVITVIEVLSPGNKRSDEGRKAYNKKRLEVLESASNLIEID